MYTYVAIVQKLVETTNMDVKPGATEVLKTGIRKRTEESNPSVIHHNYYYYNGLIINWNIS